MSAYNEHFFSSIKTKTYRLVAAAATRNVCEEKRKNERVHVKNTTWRNGHRETSAATASEGVKWDGAGFHQTRECNGLQRNGEHAASAGTGWPTQWKHEQKREI